MKAPPKQVFTPFPGTVKKPTNARPTKSTEYALTNVRKRDQTRKLIFDIFKATKYDPDSAKFKPEEITQMIETNLFELVGNSEGKEYFDKYRILQQKLKPSSASELREALLNGEQTVESLFEKSNETKPGAGRGAPLKGAFQNPFGKGMAGVPPPMRPGGPPRRRPPAYAHPPPIQMKTESIPENNAEGMFQMTDETFAEETEKIREPPIQTPPITTEKQERKKSLPHNIQEKMEEDENTEKEKNNFIKEEQPEEKKIVAPPKKETERKMSFPKPQPKIVPPPMIDPSHKKQISTHSISKEPHHEVERPIPKKNNSEKVENYFEPPPPKKQPFELMRPTPLQEKEINSEKEMDEKTKEKEDNEEGEMKGSDNEEESKQENDEEGNHKSSSIEFDELQQKEREQKEALEKLRKMREEMEEEEWAVDVEDQGETYKINEKQMDDKNENIFEIGEMKEKPNEEKESFKTSVKIEDEFILENKLDNEEDKEEISSQQEDLNEKEVEEIKKQDSLNKKNSTQEIIQIQNQKEERIKTQDSPNSVQSPNSARLNTQESISGKPPKHPPYSMRPSDLPQNFEGGFPLRMPIDWTNLTPSQGEKSVASIATRFEDSETLYKAYQKRKRENEEITKKFLVIQTEIHIEREKSQILEKENRELRESMREKQWKIEELLNKGDNDDGVQIQSILEVKGKEIDSLKNDNLHLSKEIEKLKKHLMNISQEHSNNKQQNQNIIEKLRKENQSLILQVQNQSNQNNSDNSHKNPELEQELNDHIAHLKKTLSEKEKMIGDQQEKINKLENQQVTLNQQNIQLRKTIDSQTDEIFQMKEEFDDLENELSQYKEIYFQNQLALQQKEEQPQVEEDKEPQYDDNQYEEEKIPEQKEEHIIPKPYYPRQTNPLFQPIGSDEDLMHVFDQIGFSNIGPNKEKDTNTAGTREEMEKPIGESGSTDLTESKAVKNKRRQNQREQEISHHNHQERSGQMNEQEDARNSHRIHSIKGGSGSGGENVFIDPILHVDEDDFFSNNNNNLTPKKHDESANEGGEMQGREDALTPKKKSEPQASFHFMNKPQNKIGENKEPEREMNKKIEEEKHPEEKNEGHQNVFNLPPEDIFSSIDDFGFSAFSQINNQGPFKKNRNPLDNSDNKDNVGFIPTNLFE